MTGVADDYGDTEPPEYVPPEDGPLPKECPACHKAGWHVFGCPRSDTHPTTGGEA